MEGLHGDVDATSGHRHFVFLGTSIAILIRELGVGAICRRSWRLEGDVVDNYEPMCGGETSPETLQITMRERERGRANPPPTYLLSHALTPFLTPLPLACNQDLHHEAMGAGKMNGEPNHSKFSLPTTSPSSTATPPLLSLSPTVMKKEMVANSRQATVPVGGKEEKRIPRQAST